MTEPEIPKRAYDAARRATEEPYTTPISAARVASGVAAAAPIIVAAAYRALALKYERRADVVLLGRDGSGQERRVTLLGCAENLRKEADELDSPAVNP